MYRRRYSGRRRSRSTSRRRPVRRRVTYRIPRAVRGYVRGQGLSGRFQSASSVEKKVFDYSNAVVPWSPASMVATGQGGGVTSLLAPTGAISIIQGTGTNQRIGSRLIIKSIEISGCFAIPQTGALAAEASDFVKYWVVLDKQANGALHSFIDVFAELDHATSTWLAPKSPAVTRRNIEKARRFQILCSGAFALAPTVALGAEQSSFVRSFHKYLKVNIPVLYQGATGLMGTITSNNVSMVIQSAQGNAVVQWASRLRYTDA